MFNQLTTKKLNNKENILDLNNKWKKNYYNELKEEDNELKEIVIIIIKKIFPIWFTNKRFKCNKVTIKKSYDIYDIKRYSNLDYS